MCEEALPAIDIDLCFYLYTTKNINHCDVANVTMISNVNYHRTLRKTFTYQTK